jgi:hypothetical protein
MQIVFHEVKTLQQLSARIVRSCLSVCLCLTLKPLNSKVYLWFWEGLLLSIKTDIRLPVNKAIIGRHAALMSKVFIIA